MQGVLKSRFAVTRRGQLAALLLAATLVLGGGGTPSAASEILIQCAFVGATLLWIWWAGAADEAIAQPIDRRIAWIAALPLAMVAWQLVPLPPAVWQALPGREIMARAGELVDPVPGWRAFSLAPHHTLASLLAMIPAAGLMIAVSMLGRRDRRALLLVVAIIGLAAATLGAAQLAGSDETFRLYQQSHRGWITGFFANRNAAADFFLIASLALTAWSVSRPDRRPREQAGTIALIAAQAMLAVALVLTGSRAGIALLPVALLFNLLILSSSGYAVPWRRAAIALVGLVVAALCIPWLLARSDRLGSVAQRFDVEGDFRTELWTDTLYAIGQYWPLGSGTGSFTTAYLPVERLEIVDTTYPNRAHNDYLELVLETGVVGPLVLVVIIVLVARLLWERREQEPGGRALYWFSIGTLTITALHSIVDYPLRTMALAGVCALAVGLAAPRRSSPVESRRKELA